MIVVFPSDVLERLDRIEREEGMPREETVRQAVAVWTHLTSAERKTLGLAAMRMLMMRGGER